MTIDRPSANFPGRRSCDGGVRRGSPEEEDPARARRGSVEAVARRTGGARRPAQDGDRSAGGGGRSQAREREGRRVVLQGVTACLPIRYGGCPKRPASGT